jgi:hypothetical protein
VGRASGPPRGGGVPPAPPSEPLIWLLGEEGLRAWDALPARAPARGSRVFEESRIAVLRSGGAHAFLDAGDVGIHGKGSHGHDDALSVELSLAGESFIRDAGPFVYTADLARRFLARSIRSHNVVVVDGKEASGLREDLPWTTPGEARARLDSFSLAGDLEWVLASHEGYRRLAEPVVHTRRLALARPEGVFLLHDVLFGKGEHDFRWQLLTPFQDATLDAGPEDPAREWLRANASRLADLALPAAAPVARFRVQGVRSRLRVSVLATVPGKGRVEAARLSPSYGVEQDARRLVVELRARLGQGGRALEIVTVLLAEPL